MSAAQKSNDEWNGLTEEQRNCLKWPDFLEYGDPHNVEIRRTDKDSPLGLVTIAVQDPETKKWYNITKHIRENLPAHGKVDPYEWIVAVDSKPVKNESASLTDLIKNGENVVRLSLRKAVDPLNKIAKKWGEEKDVTLYLKEKKVAFELAHFYSKEENGNIKDRILVWDVKQTAEQETSKPLNKGDELLAVHGESVEGKKLAMIFELIYRDPIPGEVNLKIREIRRGKLYNAEELPESIAVAPKFEEPLNEPNPGTCQGRTSSEFHATQESLIVVEKETDESAGRENKMQNEIYQNAAILEEESGQYPLPESEPTSKSAKDKVGLLGKCRRRLSKGSQSGSLARQISNEGYNGTPETTRKFPTPDKMCSHCVSTGENRLPDDRDEWPIDRIETYCFEKIRKLLDFETPSKVSLLSALECFKHKEALAIKQQYDKSTGGIGIAEFALGRWGASDRRHNVGTLKKIVKDTMERDDVIQELEKWEKMSVCHGCGIKDSKS